MPAAFLDLIPNYAQIVPLILCMLFISNATFINVARNFDRLYNLYGPDQMPMHTFGKNLIDSYCLFFVYLSSKDL